MDFFYYYYFLFLKLYIFLVDASPRSSAEHSLTLSSTGSLPEMKWLGAASHTTRARFQITLFLPFWVLESSFLSVLRLTLGACSLLKYSNTPLPTVRH